MYEIVYGSNVIHTSLLIQSWGTISTRALCSTHIEQEFQLTAAAPGKSSFLKDVLSADIRFAPSPLPACITPVQ